MTWSNGELGHPCRSRGTVQHSLTCLSAIRSPTEWLPSWLMRAEDKGIQPCPDLFFHDRNVTLMASANPRTAPPPMSLVDELSKLISDPRTKDAIIPIKLRDGTIVELKPERQQCGECKIFLADEKALSAHRLCCHSTCKQHKLFDTVSWEFTVNGSPIKTPWKVAQKALDHATDPTYIHACCFVEGCSYPERIPSGWQNLEVMEHVIRSHTGVLLNDQQRMRLLQGFRRPRKRLA